MIRKYQLKGVIRSSRLPHPRKVVFDLVCTRKINLPMKDYFILDTVPSHISFTFLQNIDILTIFDTFCHDLLSCSSVPEYFELINIYAGIYSPSLHLRPSQVRSSDTTGPFYWLNSVLRFNTQG